MAAEWRSIQLGEAITFQRGFDLPTQDRVPGGVPIVSSSGVSGRHVQAAAKGPGVVTGRYGTIGQVFYITEDYWPLNTTLWVKEFNGNHVRFMSYMLQTVDYWSCSDKSSVPGVNRNDLHRLPVRLPPLSEQHAIASVLGALDDKIDLNRRMCQTLEEMARALFKSWFVDFDPVRAKMEGRDPGLPNEIADLFPGRLVDSELGPIPEGWRAESIGTVVDCVGGATPSTAMPDYWDPPIHCWATPKDLSRLNTSVLRSTERQVSQSGLAKISSGLLPAGTVLMSSRAPVGYLAIAAVPTAINQGFIALKATKQASTCFLLEWCRSHLPEIRSRASGTTFPEISKQNFRQINMCLPCQNLMSTFTGIVEPLLQKVGAADTEASTLAALRDTLLPKLISGELRVPASLGSMQEVST
jgi:type I restriction enzyme S subunit